MQHHRYDLQYLIYSVALRRYLKARLPGFDSSRDFGGVYYLFVRGMPGSALRDLPGATLHDQPGASEKPAETTPCTGVYVARPPEDLLQALDQLLGGAGSSNA